jgi:hypothetical protein
LERRRYERLPFSKELEVRTIGKLAWTSARMCDVSIAGLGFQTDLCLQVGEEVWLSMPDAAEQAPISLTATVRHVAPAGKHYYVGVERNEASA